MATEYVHRHSGAKVQAEQFDTRQKWPVWGATNVRNPMTGNMEPPTEEVGRGDWQVTAGISGRTYGDDKEDRFIVPRMAFSLCYAPIGDVTPPTERPAEIATEAPQEDVLADEGYTI